MDFNRIEAEERHIFKLWTLCRVCGQAGEKLQYCLDNYNDLLHELYSLDTSKDDPAIHPQMVCQNCRVTLQPYLKKVPKSKIGKARFPSLPALYTFKRHSEECDVCDRASGLLPKRKLSMDLLEVSLSKAPRQDAGPEEGDGVVGNASAQSKGSLDELGASHESDRAQVLLQAIQGAIGEEVTIDNADEVMDRPDEQEGFTKYVYLNMIRRFKARGIKEDKTGYSVDVSRFRQKNFASTFLTCSLCKRLPLKPVTTECKHVFCETCISDWLNFGNVCPKCEEVIVELSDASEQLKHLYLLLDAPCSFASKGCEMKLTPFEINKHEKECPYSGKTDQSDSSDEDESEQQESVENTDKFPPRKKKSLRFVTQRVATSRTEELTEFVENMCAAGTEDKVDVLFYMLKDALFDCEDPRAKDVDFLWRNKRKSLLIRPKGRRAAAPIPLPRPQRQVSRRKGTPRKRGRPRKTVEVCVASDPDLDEEAQEVEDDREDTDATWKPPSGVGRRQGGGDTEESMEEDGDKEKESETINSSETETGADQGITNTNILVVQVVEGSAQGTDGPSVSIL
ncbi:uncharacterized protein [Asterias amurensis]|uniref:uncharacterized protein n=1 Tax=Asterias amurensis TaxID=7602 RepID=UPI003AB6CDA4